MDVIEVILDEVHIQLEQLHIYEVLILQGPYTCFTLYSILT